MSDSIIRDAEYRDIEEIMSLIYEFHEESLKEYKLSLSKETLEITIKNFIDNLIGLVIEKDGKVVGVMGGIASPSIFDSTQILGQEAIWYINKNHRGGTAGFRLLKEFENRCKQAGCNLISMIHMNNLSPEILDRFYKKNGYVSIETHYIKEV